MAGVKSDTNYSCTAYNDAGTSENDACVVTVIKKGKTFKQHLIEIVKACFK